MPKRQADKDPSVVSPVPLKVYRLNGERKKCDFCAKKTVHLADCRCGLSLCIPDLGDHGCTFDYKAAHRALLEKNNPAIKPEKVESF